MDVAVAVTGHGDLLALRGGGVGGLTFHRQLGHIDKPFGVDVPNLTDSNVGVCHHLVKRLGANVHLARQLTDDALVEVEARSFIRNGDSLIDLVGLGEEAPELIPASEGTVTPAVEPLQNLFVILRKVVLVAVPGEPVTRFLLIDICHWVLQTIFVINTITTANPSNKYRLCQPKNPPQTVVFGGFLIVLVS